MAKEEMTIHRALAELKLIDSKIEKQITELLPVGIHQKDKLIANHITLDDFKSGAQSKYDSISDLIARKSTIKSAIVEANGKTTVTVAGKKMTIADAINMKASIIFKKQLIATLTSKYTSAVAELNRGNDMVNQNIQRILEATFGKENTKVNKEDMDNVRTPYLSANEFHLFDPLKVKEKIDSLNKEVSEFEMEIDAALSEVNAVTKITV